jgi:hypothetical protein
VKTNGHNKRIEGTQNSIANLIARVEKSASRMSELASEAAIGREPEHCKCGRLWPIIPCLACRDKAEANKANGKETE